MAQWKKISSDIFMKKPIKKTGIIVSLDELIQERLDLIDKLAMNEPTDEELIEYAKGVHPFYFDKNAAQIRLDDLNILIPYLQGL